MFINYNYISHKSIKRPAHVSESRPKLNTNFFSSLRQTEGDEGVDATQSCQASPTLHEHRHPAANRASPSTLPTLDSD